MQYKNSYIFLKRSKKEKKIHDKTNAIVVNLTPSFMTMLKESFKKITFDDEKNDSINSG